uniref:Transcription cofactor HES-6 n=1 Tax=Equus asinus TaxID=9793 RepID=A0A8C4LIJ5_EQUAS
RGWAGGGPRGRGLSRPLPAGSEALVEKKRRARINESLQELRLLLAGAEVQAKLENAEVLELTVRRVQGALRGRARGEWRGTGGWGRGLRAPATWAWGAFAQLVPAGTEDFPAQRSCAVGGEGFPRRISWVSPAIAGWAGGSAAVAAHRAGTALSFPLPGAERDQLQAEASERFAAGYIQCMHEVHTFVSTCQAIDATVAAQLLNHLLESMPLREGSSFRDLLGDALAAPPGAPGRSRWLTGGTVGSPQPSPPGPRDDLCSDLEEAPEAELSPAPAEEPELVLPALGSLTAARISQSIWRPW